MTKKTAIPDAAFEARKEEPQGKGFGDFLRDPWSPKDPLCDVKLQMRNLLAYHGDMLPNEISQLFNSLTEQQQEKLAAIMTEFLNAAHDDSIDFLLIQVPKGAVSSHSATISRVIPTIFSEDNMEGGQQNSVEALAAWRRVERLRKKTQRDQMSPKEAAEHNAKASNSMREYRSRMSPEQMEEARVKAAERMRRKRAEGKQSNSNP